MSHPLEAALSARSATCELCGAEGPLSVFDVPPAEVVDASRSLRVCDTCRSQVEGAELDENHWYCLQGAAWSEVPAVQVLAWRLLHRLGAPWAVELLDQIYLDEDLRAWAEQGLASAESAVVVRDANGAPLTDGDSVTIIKDLDVKGAGFVAKRGTTVKNIRLGDDPTHVEGRVNGVSIFLKTEFLKRLSG